MTKKLFNALSNCKDCGKKVSISAKVCPKCGVEAPTKNFLKYPKCLIKDCNEYALEGFHGMCIDDYKKEKSKNTNKILIAVFLFLFLISLSIFK